MLLAGVVGDLSWVIAYVLTIYVGFRDHSYGIPLVAVCLNITWELIFTFIIKPASRLKFLLNTAWFLLDLIILYQVYRYGRAEQVIPELQQYFTLVLTGTLFYCLIGHWSFHLYYGDEGGEDAAFAINLIMSILFVFLLFDRRDFHGLSYGAAWAKFIGTSVLSIANTYLIFKHKKKASFPLFLYASIFVFDVLYIALLYLHHVRDL